jgi:hypothetical protein
MNYLTSVLRLFSPCHNFEGFSVILFSLTLISNGHFLAFPSDLASSTGSHRNEGERFVKSLTSGERSRCERVRRKTLSDLQSHAAQTASIASHLHSSSPRSSTAFAHPPTHASVPVYLVNSLHLKATTSSPHRRRQAYQAYRGLNTYCDSHQAVIRGPTVSPSSSYLPVEGPIRLPSPLEPFG